MATHLRLNHSRALGSDTLNALGDVDLAVKSWGQVGQHSSQINSTIMYCQLLRELSCHVGAAGDKLVYQLCVDQGSGRREIQSTLSKADTLGTKATVRFRECPLRQS